MEIEIEKNMLVNSNKVSVIKKWTDKHIRKDN